MGTKLRLTSLLLFVTALIAAPVTAQETTSGTVEGVVKDTTAVAIPGVTISLMSEQGTKTALTGTNGDFRFTYLVPGEYTLRAELVGFNTVEQPKIAVRLGSRINLQVVLSEGASDTIDVLGTAPVVDLNSTTSGANISNELMKSVPIGRTFAATLTLAPGVVESGVPGSGGGSNPSIGGASGLENTYVIDGVNIGNTGYGSAGSYSIVFGSLGTGVNFDYIQEVQVKTGGYEPEYGEALGGFVNIVTKSGGNDVKGNGYVYYQPDWLEGQREEFDLTNASFDNSSVELTQSDVGLDASGPVARDKAFYFGAFNPSFERFTRSTYHTVVESQGIDETIDRKRTIWNYVGKVDWALNPQHGLTFSAFGDPSKGNFGGQRNGSLTVIVPDDRFSELRYGGHNMSARWNGELASNWFAEATLGRHKDKFEEILSSNVPGGDDRVVPADTPFVQLGGVGFNANSDSGNTQFKLKLSNFFDAAGEHNLRYGIEYQDISYTNTADYSGPRGSIVLPDGRASTSGFTFSIRSNHFRVPRVRFNDLSTDTTSKYTSFYVSDSWSPTRHVNLMGGVRYEKDKLVGNLTEFEWADNWGPRFHATWDPTKDGKTKLGFSWGRFYGKIPQDLAIRALSDEVTGFLIYDLADVDLSDRAFPVVRPGATPLDQIFFGDVATEVLDDSKITVQDEFIVNAEREILPFFNLGASFMYRDLGRTLEDFATVPYSAILNGTADFGHYVIGNPDLAHPDLFPPVSRKYKAFTLKADKRMHENWQMLASYTWSELKGNYEGFFRRDNGQSDPFITSLFDFPYLADPDIWEHIINDGFLPNDRSHVFNLYGSYVFANNDSAVDGLNIGLGLRIQSGLPLTKLGFNEVYANGGEIPLEARGSAGRGDTTTMFDLTADYPINLGGGQLHLIMTVFNLFNAQDAIDYDMDFETGCAGCPNVDFAKVVSFQAPRQIRFAGRMSF